MEGKKFYDLMVMSQKMKCHFRDIVPEGAETYVDVRKRGASFFEKLCCSEFHNYEFNVDTYSSAMSRCCLLAKGLQRFYHVEEENLGTEQPTLSNSCSPNDVSHYAPGASAPAKSSGSEEGDDGLETKQTHQPGACATSNESLQLGLHSYNEKCRCMEPYQPPNFEADGHSTLKDIDLNVSNVLVTSHGGMIRELILHFTKDLVCPIPEEYKTVNLQRVSPNTGFSIFEVRLKPSSSDSGFSPSLRCLVLYEKPHLNTKK